jgi:hypothetical protein
MSDLKQQQKQNNRIRKECEGQRQDMKDQREALTIQHQQQKDANDRKAASTK